MNKIESRAREAVGKVLGGGFKIPEREAWDVIVPAPTRGTITGPVKEILVGDRLLHLYHIWTVLSREQDILFLEGLYREDVLKPNPFALKRYVSVYVIRDKYKPFIESDPYFGQNDYDVEGKYVEPPTLEWFRGFGIIALRDQNPVTGETIDNSGHECFSKQRTYETFHRWVEREKEKPKERAIKRQKEQAIIDRNRTWYDNLNEMDEEFYNLHCELKTLTIHPIKDNEARIKAICSRLSEITTFRKCGDPNVNISKPSKW